VYSKLHTNIYKDNLLYTGVFLASTQTHRAVGRYSHQARFAAALSRKLAVLRVNDQTKSASVTHKRLVIIDNQTANLHAGKVQQSRTGLDWPRGFQVVKVPRFHDNGTGWWYGCQLHAPAAFTPRKCSWYSFLLEAESTPGPEYKRKDYVNEKFH